MLPTPAFPALTTSFRLLVFTESSEAAMAQGDYRPTTRGTRIVRREQVLANANLSSLRHLVRYPDGDHSSQTHHSARLYRGKSRIKYCLGNSGRGRFNLCSFLVSDSQRMISRPSHLSQKLTTIAESTFRNLYSRPPVSTAT
jgi:hypothetical protein